MTTWEVFAFGWKMIVSLVAIYAVVTVILVLVANRLAGSLGALAVCCVSIGYLFFKSQPMYQNFDVIIRATHPHDFSTFSCPRTLSWVGFNGYSGDYFMFIHDCYASPTSMALIGLMFVGILCRTFIDFSTSARN